MTIKKPEKLGRGVFRNETDGVCCSVGHLCEQLKPGHLDLWYMPLEIVVEQGTKTPIDLVSEILKVPRAEVEQLAYDNDSCFDSDDRIKVFVNWCEEHGIEVT